MYEISVISSFSAAHALKGYKGKCEKLHGHNWKVKATFFGNKLDKTGILVDFNEAKKILNIVISKLDHSNLNTHIFFRKRNPSSETIAEYIFNSIKNRLRNREIKLKLIEIWENETNSAIYYETTNAP